jgi:HAD superfamily hydrolase (TIGR01484 family)
MLLLSDWPLDARQNLVGVFTDIDDTLTLHGSITPDALKALADLKAAGLQVIAITGRPIGWCEVLAKGDVDRGLLPWPVDAVVAENGAVAWVGHHAKRHKIYQQDAPVRARNRARMRAVGQRILREVPGALLTRDSDGRETDLAFDAAEFARLSTEQIAQIVSIMQGEGMHTTVSSIHIHGCFGLFNKWRGACWIAQQLLGRRLEEEIQRWAFVGDSGNDVAMFEYFTHSVGVANIRRVAPGLSHLPRYIAPSENGAGFAEVAAAILAARE